MGRKPSLFCQVTSQEFVTCHSSWWSSSQQFAQVRKGTTREHMLERIAIKTINHMWAISRFAHLGPKRGSTFDRPIRSWLISFSWRFCSSTCPLPLRGCIYNNLWEIIEKLQHHKITQPPLPQASAVETRLKLHLGMCNLPKSSVGNYNLLKVNESIKIPHALKFVTKISWNEDVLKKLDTCTF